MSDGLTVHWGYLMPAQFRDGVWIPLLERGYPSTHHRSREIVRERQAQKKAELYLQVMQF